MKEITELMVRCSSVERGCSWTGTLGSFDAHVRTACQFVLIQCPRSCDGDGTSGGKNEFYIMRKDLDNHLKLECPKRPYTCPHCREEGTYASIDVNHYRVCDNVKVPCHNRGKGCQCSMERWKVDDHVRRECEYAEVSCTYKSLGCGVSKLRKDMGRHQLNDDVDHLHLVLSTVCSHEEQFRTLRDGEAVVFKVTEYTSKKKRKEIYYSDPFYTHPGGYNVCIAVYPNGISDGDSTHLSVRVKILRGSHDHMLRWPFVGYAEYELLNQLSDDNHHYRVSHFDGLKEMYVNSCKGPVTFLPHSSLCYDSDTKVRYLLNDTLHFRVLVKTNKKVWLASAEKMSKSCVRPAITLKDCDSVMLRITDYNSKKAHDSVYHSKPFYSNPKGYRMQAIFYANGFGTSEGSHISIYLKILNGIHDADLHWPFTGTVIFTLLNQLSDKKHIDAKVEHKVTDGVHVGMGRGLQNFVPHENLPFNAVNQTQYLKNDMLYVKLEVVQLEHRAWLSSTHYI